VIAALAPPPSSDGPLRDAFGSPGEWSWLDDARALRAGEAPARARAAHEDLVS